MEDSLLPAVGVPICIVRICAFSHRKEKCVREVVCTATLIVYFVCSTDVAIEGYGSIRVR